MPLRFVKSPYNIRKSRLGMKAKKAPKKLYQNQKYSVMNKMF